MGASEIFEVSKIFGASKTFGAAETYGATETSSASKGNGNPGPIGAAGADTTSARAAASMAIGATSAGYITTTDGTPNAIAGESTCITGAAESGAK